MSAQAAHTLPELPPAKHLRSGNCDIAYYVAGPEDGNPLLLCHGLAAGALQFADDIAFFADQGFRVMAPDLRGHGNSSLPDADDGTAYAVSTLASDLIAILDAEGIAQTDWVGNSLGGIIALEIMGSAPQRLGKVIFFGTAYALNLPRLIVRGISIGYAVIGQRLLAQVTARMTCPGKRAQSIIAATLRAARPKAVTGIAAHVRHYDLTANAQNFDKPILMIRSDKDGAVNLALPKSIAAMKDKTNFQLVELTDAGHCANLDQPQAVRDAIMQFIAKAQT